MVGLSLRAYGVLSLQEFCEGARIISISRLVEWLSLCEESSLQKKDISRSDGVGLVFYGLYNDD